jgi:Tol biopolymer transport system component
MPLPNAFRLGSYEIVGPIGAGAMGEVYRARDTRLGRDVAVKVLPLDLTSDAERLTRFEREARVLAALNHPNIATIHGIEEHGAGRALVMELVDGQTLAELCARRRKGRDVPLADVLGIARQIAAALEAAHDKGIVHRDLKPANIKVNSAGIVKVLDFGLAKIRAAGANVADEPGITFAAAGTREGVMLGTPAYMSPEQARGFAVDASADVWAFGCVVYELLTGQRAFGGETTSDTIAAVLEHEPDWTRLPRNAPGSVRRLLQRCLQKDSRQRLRDMSAVRILVEDAVSALDSTSSGASFDGLAGRARARTRRAWVITAIAGVAVIAGAAVALRPSVPVSPETRLDIATPPTTDPASFSISPDGRSIVFVATVDSVPRLWLRTLDSVAAAPLAGTGSAYLPFWSPDNRSVGFFAEGKLKRIDLGTKSVQVLADATAGRGGTWNAAGDILFAPQSGPIFRIAESGGERTQVTRPDPESSHRFPEFLPDGRHFIYFERTALDPLGLKVGDLAGSEARDLVAADARGAYIEPGQLLFIRQGTLYAQSFDATQIVLSGSPVPVAADVMVNPTNIPGSAALSASATGLFVYRVGPAPRRQIQWLDRVGRTLGNVGDADPRRPQGLALSPDGRSLAMTRTVDGNQDVWLLDTARGALTRFTSAPRADNDPIWSADGSRLVFVSARQGPGDLYEKPASGAADEQLLLEVSPLAAYNTEWSADGRVLLFDTQDVTSRFDMWALSIDGPREPYSVLQTNFDEMSGQFSPDGAWIAYQSNESGRFEIYVRPFPGPGTRWPVSTNGGTHVRWGRDGKELFYLAPGNLLMAVPIELDSERQTASIGAPVPLFTARVGTLAPVDSYQYAVAGDGQRFLVNTVLEDANPPPITVVQNWKPPR